MASVAPTLVQMMRTGEYSDLVLSCQGVEFRVHKLVVCGKSSKIKASIASGSQGPSSAVIVTDQFRLSTVNRFVQFLYTDTYKEPDLAEDDEEHVPGVDEQAMTTTSEVATFESTLLGHIYMNAVGLSYDVQDLVDYSSVKIKELLDSLPHNLPRIACVPRAINEARQSQVDPGARDSLGRATALNINKLVHMESFQKLPFMSPFPLQVVKELAGSLEELSAGVATEKAITEKDLQAMYEGKLETATATHRSEIERLQSKHKSELEQAEAKSEQKLEELRKQNEKRNSQQGSNWMAKMTQLESRVTEKLQTEHAANHQATLAKHQAAVQRLEEKHRSELRNAKFQASQEAINLGIKLQDYQAVVAELQDVDECRNCGQELWGKIQIPRSHVSAHPFIQRCANCDCKHPR